MIGTETPAIPKDVLSEPRIIDAILVHKYLMGVEQKRDPTIIEAETDFFQKHYSRVREELTQYDCNEEKKAIRKKALQLFKEGKIRELVNKGEILPKRREIYSYATDELINSGWAADYRNRLESPERNQLDVVDIDVRRNGMTSLKDILKGCDCDVYVKTHDGWGDISLMGDSYIRLSEKNDICATSGRRIRLLLYGKDAVFATTRLTSVLNETEQKSLEGVLQAA